MNSGSLSANVTKKLTPNCANKFISTENYLPSSQLTQLSNIKKGQDQIENKFPLRSLTLNADLPEETKTKQNLHEYSSYCLTKISSKNIFSDVDLRPSREKDLQSLLGTTSAKNELGSSNILHLQVERNIASPKLDFLPTRKPMRNEYNIEQYLPKKNFLKTEPELMDYKTEYTSIGLVDKYNQNLYPKQLLTEEPHKTNDLRFTNESLEIRNADTNTISTFSETGLAMGLKRLLDIRGEDSKQKELQGKNGDEFEKTIYLKGRFIQVLEKFYGIEKSHEVASKLIEIVNEASEKEKGSRNKGIISNVQKVDNLNDNSNKKLSLFKIEPVDYMSFNGPNTMSPNENNTRKDGFELQKDKEVYSHAHTSSKKDREKSVESKQNQTTKKRTNFSCKEFSSMLSRPDSKPNQVETSYLSYSSSKVQEDYQNILREIENKTQSTRNSKNLSKDFGIVLDKRDLTRTCQKEAPLSQKNDFRKELESSFLKKLELSHQKFNAHLKERIEDSKINVQNKFVQNSSTKALDQSITNGLSRKTVQLTLSSNKKDKSLYRSPEPSINEKLQKEQKIEEEGLKILKTTFKNDKYFYQDTPIKSFPDEIIYQKKEEKLNENKWHDLKFLEDEDLELLIKSFI